MLLQSFQKGIIGSSKIFLKKSKWVPIMQNFTPSTKRFKNRKKVYYAKVTHKKLKQGMRKRTKSALLADYFDPNFFCMLFG